MPTIPPRKSITERLMAMVAWRPGVALTNWQPKFLSEDEKISVKYMAAALQSQNKNEGEK